MGAVSIYGAISNMVDRNPGKVALEYGNISCTYLELHRISNHIAGILSSLQIEDKNILTLIDRSPFLIQAVLGILKSGRAFMPADYRIPENRLRSIMEQTRCNWVAAGVQYLDMLNRIAAAGMKKINVVVESHFGMEAHDYANLNIYSADSFPFNGEEKTCLYNENCYVYFTSGSTGIPKGVLGRHTSLKHFIDWEIEQFGVNGSFRVSQLINPAFDPFLRDVFVPLCSGATICMPEEQDTVLNPGKLINWLDGKDISLIHMVPTMFKAIVREIEDSNRFQNLKYILLAGELLKGTDLKRFYELFGSRIQLVNLYGPTETTLAKAFYMISPSDTDRTVIPVGKPIKDTELIIMDSEMKPCPEGSTGEIFIYTSYISSGYLNDRELTERVFIRHPLGADEADVIYKTGDLGRALPDGNIECLGRIDNQIKIRGMRIELSEIEVRLLGIDTVREAVAVAREDEDGDKFICAFLTGDSELDFYHIREKLSGELPDYMVPSRFVQLDRLPLLPNGKVDRNSLCNCDIDNDNGEDLQSPVNETEEKLAELWKKVLHIRNTGVTENFLLSGGNSLNAAKLALMIQKEFCVGVSVKEVLNNPTIRELAELIGRSGKLRCTSIPAVKEREYYLASSAQKRLFLINLIEDAGIAYNMPGALLIEGCPDKELLDNAFRCITGRHEALRTSFEVIDGEIVQRIHKNVNFKMEFIDAAYMQQDTKKEDTQISELMGDFVRPFDLGRPPLFRVRLVRIAEERYVLLRDMHHIISDGISEEILKAELVKLYSGQQPDGPGVQYRDFTSWQNNLKSSESVKKQEKYWLEVLSGEIPVLNLPTDFARPSKQSFDGAVIRFALDVDFTKEIRRLAAENGVTLYMLLLAVLNILLSRYTGQEDILIGSPVAGRNHPDLENVIGVFINTLVMRNCPDGTKTFREFLGEVRENTLRAIENQDCQFENIVEKLSISRDFSRNPLFDVMFAMQNMHFEKVMLDNLKVMEQRPDRSVSKFDITLTATESGDSLEFYLEYCTKLFRKETMERLVKHFVNILKFVACNMGVKLSEIDMLSKEEKERIIYGFNRTGMDYPYDMTIHKLFSEQAGKNPEKTALIFGDKKMSYRELDIKSNQLARTLREKGVKADTVVGLMLPRSMDMLVGMLGILKAGGAYLPIDPGYPPERIRYMIEDSGTDILLVQNTIQPLLGVSDNEKPLYSKTEGGKLRYEGEKDIDVIDLGDSSPYCSDGSSIGEVCGSQSLAYVIYTSGSTGKPKGVMIEHRNVINLIRGFTDKLDFSPDRNVLCLTTVSFDIFVLETLVPLANGNTIVIANEIQQLDPGALCELITGNRVDILQITPSRLQMVLQYGNTLEHLEGIKELIIGGEAFPGMLLGVLRRLKNTRIYNVYGPTETTVWSTVKDLTGSESISIGKPIANTRAFILDKYRRPQPQGIAGELYLSGEGLSRGYLNMPELTAERFVSNPFEAGGQFGGENKGRMYRTGDMARFLPDGEIEFLGRMDTQVKVRGYRIELGEIEKCMLEHCNIINSVCVAREDNNGNRHLAAYYISEKEIPASEIRAQLGKFLPDYMVPQSYTLLEKFPMTPNGKIDRRMLPEPDRQRRDLKTEQTCEMNEAEKKVMSVWKEILGLESIGTDENFFDAGGNSLLLVLMHNALEGLFPGRIGIADIFANPTVSMLAKFINTREVCSEGTGITPLELPDDYFADAPENIENVVFEYTIEEELYGSFITLKEYGYDFEVILFSAFALLMAEVSGQEKVAIQKAAGRNSAAQLVMNLSDMNDVTGLFEKVKHNLTFKAINSQYPLNSHGMKKAVHGKNHAIVAFADAEGVSIRDFGLCHMLLKQVAKDGHINLELQYDPYRIRTDKAAELFGWFIKTAELITKKYLYSKRKI